MQRFEPNTHGDINDEYGMTPAEDGRWVRFADHVLTVDQVALRVLSSAFDDFLRKCVDDSGNPKTPSARDIAKARGYLPPRCLMAYK